MKNKINLLILLPVSVGILLVVMFISREEGVHNSLSNVEENIVSKNGLFENDEIENKTDFQLSNNSKIIKGPESHKNNDLQDLYEVRSLVDWVNQIDDIVSSQTLDADLKIKKIINWLIENNTPNEIRVKLYRALVQLKPINYIEEIFSLINKENSLEIKLAGIEALALVGKKLITSGYAEGQLILNLLKGVGQQTQEPMASKKLNSLVSYMEHVLAGNKNELIKIEYLTSKDAYIWDLSAKLEGVGNIKHGLSGLLNDISALVDQDKELLNEEYSKLNLAYLDYFSNGFGGDIPSHQDMNQFFKKIKPQKTETLTDDAVSRYRIWLTAYSYVSERGSNSYNDFIINELRVADSPVAALVLVENGLNVIDQLSPSAREKLINLLEENGVTEQEGLSEEVSEVLSLLVK